MDYRPTITVINYVHKNEVVGCAMEFADGWKFFAYNDKGGDTRWPKPSPAEVIPAWLKARKVELVYLKQPRDGI